MHCDTILQNNFFEERLQLPINYSLTHNFKADLAFRESSIFLDLFV